MIFPELEVLRPLHPQSIREEHLEGLPAIAEANWSGISAFDLVDEIRDGRVVLWEAPEGIVLTRIEAGPRERALVLDGVAGHGILRKARAISRDIHRLALHYGVQRVESSSRDTRWAKLGQRLGFFPVSTTYVMEVDYERR